MKYPSRVRAHIAESESLRAFAACLPSAWILRHVTERDYGLDCLVELVWPDGQMRGDLAAVQLKAKSMLPWKPPAADGSCTAPVSGIASESAAYWLGLPMPVVIAVWERASGGVYVAPVKAQLRLQFGKISRQGTISMEVCSTSDIRTSDGMVVLVAEYLRERAYNGFAAALFALLKDARHHHGFLFDNLALDSFLAVEEGTLFSFIGLHRQVSTVLEFTGRRVSLTPIRDWYRLDRSVCGDEWQGLHHRTLDMALRELIPAYISALRAAHRLVLGDQREYWEHNDGALVEFCESWVAEDCIARVDRDARFNNLIA